MPLMLPKLKAAMMAATTEEVGIKIFVMCMKIFLQSLKMTTKISIIFELIFEC